MASLCSNLKVLLNMKEILRPLPLRYHTTYIITTPHMCSSKIIWSQESSERSHSGSLRTRSDSRSPFQRSPSMVRIYVRRIIYYTISLIRTQWFFSGLNNFWHCCLCYSLTSQASCHFNKVSGGVYHMYLRKDGTAYFSMLSPKERGASSHSSYLGSYRENKDAKVKKMNGTNFDEVT